ncbi:4Fe-4S dicluster domain-containing protein [Pseudodesulfovibrio sp. JC047]|uniref:4Fe-4S dicluster domain-containing protein n=1 Tax=Pseudodesulfovibrio sp. JC047 TaxID=2683199 RepID=UPI0013D74BB6|nr:4Fe-4S dicluster domain-containing protein [Pseudodesulfovibrio sp. JC047]NDV20963.1 4Fe-4S dicluster domain-containing protein [Pseudodesulfovibrio sp. JC047]
MSESYKKTWSPVEDEKQLILAQLQKEVGACMQCGTCTASCPNGFAMDITPRTMWRMIQFGMVDEIFESHTFWMCSSCYTCTLRCPRGLKLTSVMASLKRLAMLSGKGRKNSAFYRAFMENIESHGRVQEMGMMSNYFFKRMDNPTLPLKFVPLGMKMMAKGKVHIPGGGQGAILKPLFAKAREMEGLS